MFVTGVFPASQNRCTRTDRVVGGRVRVHRGQTKASRGGTYSGRHRRSCRRMRSTRWCGTRSPRSLSPPVHGNGTPTDPPDRPEDEWREDGEGVTGRRAPVVSEEKTGGGGGRGPDVRGLRGLCTEPNAVGLASSTVCSGPLPFAPHLNEDAPPAPRPPHRPSPHAARKLGRRTVEVQ